MILKNVHRVFPFTQEAWLKEYIDMIVKLRTEAKNDFEKNFLKLIILFFWKDNGKCKKA